MAGYKEVKFLWCGKPTYNYPCATCLRWSECNGVDTECPLISKDRKEIRSVC